MDMHVWILKRTDTRTHICTHIIERACRMSTTTTPHFLSPPLVVDDVCGVSLPGDIFTWRSANQFGEWGDRACSFHRTKSNQQGPPLPVRCRKRGLLQTTTHHLLLMLYTPEHNCQATVLTAGLGWTRSVVALEASSMLVTHT